MNPKLKLSAKRWSRRLLLTAVWIGGLGTLFYGIENWRAKRALAEHYEWLKSKGESLDPAQFDPPPVPDEDNAALVPVLECFYTKDANGNRGWAINSIGNVPEGLPEEQKAKLREWARLNNAMRLLPSKFPRMENGALDYEHYLNEAILAANRVKKSDPQKQMPPLPEGAAPAEEKLQLYLQQFSPMLEGLREAGQRTNCVWPGTRSSINFPRAGISMSQFRTLNIDATFAIHKGDASAALLDLETMAVLSLDNTSGTGSLISGLVTSAQWKLYLKCMETILAGQSGSEEHWARIAQKSPTPHIQNFFKSCLRGERVFREQYRSSANFMRDTDQTESPIYTALRLAPSGWIIRNYIAMNQETQAWIELLDGNEPPLLAKAINRAYVPHNSIYDFMVNSTSDMKVWKQMAETAEALQLAPVAIALKRYQIKHGAFPDELTQVIPEFLPKLPQSYFDAMTPKYRRLPNSSFKIWFNGLDKDDDDGRAEDQSKTSRSMHDYDIVLTPGPQIPSTLEKVSITR